MARPFAQMVVGDHIALKSVASRSAGVPFFNADQPVSVMTLHARGTITRIDAASGVIGVDWDPRFEPHDWYLWTLSLPVVRADDSQPLSKALLAFAFGEAAQDVDSFVANAYWANRYPRRPGLSWIPFYTEFATRLLQYREDRPALVSIILDLASTERLLNYLATDRYDEDTSGPINDLDPFTVMGVFNRSLTDTNRRAMAERLGRRIGVTVGPPADFDSVPVLNNQNSWFTYYSKTRGVDDVPTLWRTFAAAIEFAASDTPQSREELVAAYDAAQNIGNIHWNLSQGMFWARPQVFATLEGNSRPYIQKRFGLAPPKDGAGYVRLLDSLRQRFADGSTSITSFPLLSYGAWFDTSVEATPHTIEGFAQWAARLAEWVDVEESEHRYKRRAAASMRAARDEAQAGNPEWPAAFKRAMGDAGTLLHFMFKDDVVKAVQADPAAWFAVFDAVWQAGAPSALSGLQAELKARLSKASPGNCTSLGALLLMADDAEANAPYKPSRTEKWYALTGRPDRGGAARRAPAGGVPLFSGITGSVCRAGPDGAASTRITPVSFVRRITQPNAGDIAHPGRESPCPAAQTLTQRRDARSARLARTSCAEIRAKDADATVLSSAIVRAAFGDEGSAADSHADIDTSDRSLLGPPTTRFGTQLVTVA